MEKLGYGPAKRLSVALSSRNIPPYRDPAVILIDQVRDIYIDAVLEPIETANWFPKIYRKDYTIAINGTESGVDDPDQQFYENFVCGAVRNYTGYCNREVDALIDRQSAEPDREKRKQLVWPIPGRVKTRLVPPLTHEDAARVARASLEDTARFLVPEVPASWTLFLDGDPDPGLRGLAEETGLPILPQRGATLGERLKAAFRELRARGASRVLAIGSDAPTLDPRRIHEAIEALQICDVALGPTQDRGHYLIGTSGEDEQIFDGIPWGDDATPRG